MSPLQMITSLLALAAAFSTAAWAQARFPELPVSASKLSILQTKQINVKAFDCRLPNKEIQAVCVTGLRIVNKELAAAGLVVNPNEVLFNFNDPRKIVLAESCSSTTEINNINVKATFKNFQNLNVMGNILSEPLVVPYRVPVKVRAKVDARQQFGLSLFGRCNRLFSDKVCINGALDTNADVVFGINLSPMLKKLPNGNYLVRIKPEIALTFTLESFDLKFEFTGVSFLSRILGVLTTFFTNREKFFDAAISLFRGASLNDIWDKIMSSVGGNYGIPIILGTGLLPRDIEKTLLEIFDDPIERALEKRAKGFQKDIEDKLNDIVRKALKVGPDGTRAFTLKKEIVEAYKRLPKK